MADFDMAYNKTNLNESGTRHIHVWSSTPSDKGGETYGGISRVHNGDWAGWPVIDAQKGKPNFPANLQDEEIREKLYPLHRLLFKARYWIPVWGDKVKVQKVANELYDTAVWQGVGTSVKLSEKAAGLMETGKMSDVLLNKLNALS